MADLRSWFTFGTPSKSTPPSTKLILGKSSSVPGNPSVATPTWDVEKDTDNLFREHGVEEIKQIEKQTRLDIDSRREDLRQMVGERYRDLIDAADSIVDMQKCSEQVKLSVETTEVLCQKLQQTYFLKGSGAMKGPLAKNETHEVAAQLRLLADCPEEVWVCLEEQRYLQAAQHYLLARHVYSQLGLGLTGRAKELVGNGAVQKLWQSVACFKDTILECCSSHLQCCYLEEGPMVQSLCAMVLLEGCSTRHVFNQFLLARKAIIQSTFHSGSGMSQHRSVKSQVCHLVKMILHSLFHIANIFCQPAGKKEPSLLLKQLLQFSHKDNQSKSKGLCSILVPEDILPLLPPSVLEFSPTLRSTILTDIPAGDIHSSTEDWISTCASDVVSGVSKLLQHVNSIKAVSSIKLAVHSLLATSPTTDGNSDSASFLDSTSWAEQWSGVCLLVLNRELKIWDTFFQAVLLQKVNLILDKRFSVASIHASNQLSNLLTSMSSDPTSFHDDVHCHLHLWKEDSPYHHPHQQQQNGGSRPAEVSDVSWKSKSCTPAIYRFCEELGMELKGLLEDVSHYIQPPQTQVTLPTLSSKQLDSFPFPLYADTASLQDYIQGSAVEWISRFLQHVDVSVTKLQSSAGRGTSERDQATQTINMLLVIGRLCQCLLESCHSLSFLVSGARPHQFNKFAIGMKDKEGDETALAGAGMLQQRATSIFKVWAEWTASQIAGQLRQHLSSDLQLSSLASSLVWNEITISEEAESGKKVSSVIHVPSQASTCVTALLYSLCQEVGRVGGHAMERPILQHLSSVTLVGMVQAHEDFLGDLEGRGLDVPQPCALQLFYDVKFLLGVLMLPKDAEDKVSKQIKSVLERLQGWVDPFDLDVFMPFLLSNLDYQLSRSSVMLGVLLAVKGSLLRPQLTSSSGATQDKHMVLPLSPMVGRIPVLPLSSKPIQSQLHQVSAYHAQEWRQSASLLQTISFFHHL